MIIPDWQVQAITYLVYIIIALPIGAGVFFPIWYYWDRLKKIKIRDSTLIFLFSFKGLFLLIVGLSDIVAFKTMNDRYGLIAISVIYLTIMWFCVWWQRGNESRIMNRVEG